MKSLRFAVMLILLSISTVFAQMPAYPNPSPWPGGGNVMGPARADDQVAQQAASAGSYTFTDIDPPGTTLTEAHGINNSGKVVGTYSDGKFYHGFTYSAGVFTTLDYPGATNTLVYGISNNDLILGEWWSPGGPGYFVRSSNGQFTTIDPPGPPHGINSNGKVVGTYLSTPGILWPYHGFVYSGGSFTTLDYPGATSTGACGINDSDQVAGDYISPSNNVNGFMVTGSDFTTIDYPGANTSEAQSINNKAQVAGSYTDASGVAHAYVYSGGSFTTLDYPGAIHTLATGINDNGEVVGWWHDASNNVHGFLASLSYSISGTVKKKNGTPVEEVTITLGGTSSDTTKTAFDGTYSFSDLKSGPYTLTPSKDKYTFIPKSINATITDQDLVSQDFTLQTFTISGAVKTKKGEPADGVSMVLTGESSDTTDTASDGTYSFQDLGNGTYTVTPTPNIDWYYISPPFKNVLLNGKDVKNVNFTGKTPHNISGRILQGITPVPGATLTLTNTATAQTAQATTDSEGNYEFDSLLDGQYVVAPSLAGFAFKPASRKVKLADSDVADVNFSATALHSISGTVTLGGTPLSGATITLTGKPKATTTTGADGSYSFANLLSGGKYTLTPKMSGYTFTPAKITVTITNMDVANQNFAGK